LELVTGAAGAPGAPEERDRTLLSSYQHWQAHVQNWSKSLWVQWACIIACWCCPVHMKQLPFPARFAAPQTVRSVVSHCGDSGGGGGDAGGCFVDEPHVKL